MCARENIIIAFWNLYEYKPINKITVTELMNKAGYHRSVFYLYFKDIYDLLEQEKTRFFNKLNDFLPYVLEIFLQDNYNKYTLTKIQKFFDRYIPKVYILLGEHGDMAFQFKLKQIIRNHIYSIFHLTKDDYKQVLAVEFFINGHINTILYVYKHQEHLRLEDYIKLIKPILKTILLFN